MGLAGPKRRTKISADPNNTSWSSRTDRFGHKILTSQGWTPGQYLGASDAGHAEHYTAANASHIRVLLKDDTLGLGADRKNGGGAETFGLAQFSGLLGRLNGKSEAVLGKEEEARRDVRLRLWADGRGGAVRFVSAGFLVGDKVEKLRREEVERKQKELEDAGKGNRGKKRGVDGRVKIEDTAPSSSEGRDESSDDADGTDEADTKRRRKEEKRKRKEEKQERKERKRLRREAREEKRRRGGKDEAGSSAVDTPTDGAMTPNTSTEEVLVESVQSNGETAQRMMAIPRRMIRSRYIQSKRMAGLDPKALNEIFMIKTPVPQ